MTKRSVYILVCLMAFVASALCGPEVYAGQPIRTRAEVEKLRASRPRRAQGIRVPGARVHAGDKQLYGFHCYADDGDLWGWYGAVKVLAGTACPEPVFEITDDAVFQAAYMNGKAFVVLFDAFNPTYITYRVYDTETWEQEANARYTTTSSHILPYGLAYDHTTDRVYGSFFADPARFTATDEADFGYVDFSNAFDPVKIVGSLPTRMRAMTFDANGDLYALSFDDDLYLINKFTGEATETGVHVDLPTWDDADPTAPWSSYGRESMCCDWETGDFYIAYSDDMWFTYVARFNPTTGEAEMVADFNENYDCNVLTGLYFIQSAGSSDKTIPAAIKEVEAEAVGTELKAKLTFTMPSVDSEGKALDADLVWSVSDGKNELGTGKAHSGTKVTTTVDAVTPGRTTFVVTTSLDGAMSNPASTTAFIGCDVPEIYGLPTVRAAGLKLTVTWNAADALNGGNLDPVTYKVTRMPDNVVVAEAHTTTTFIDQLTSDYKTQYSYIIQPKSGNNEGTPVTSRSVIAGKYIEIPLDEQFDNEQMFLQYPVIDANGDDNLWEYSSKYGGVAMYPANDNPANDYLLIGPFKMDAGAMYTFHMTADGHNYNETVAVYVGTDPDDVKTFDTELVPPSILNPSQGRKTFDAAFEPKASGEYYFGIKACSENTSSQFIYVYEVAVKVVGGEAPAAPVAFELVPEAKTATLKFTLPDKRINGTALDKLTAVNVYRDNSLIGTVTAGVAPGAKLSYTDTDEVSKGYHSYSLAAVNADGEGKPVTDQVWRGADMPGRPSNLRFWEDLETPGLMHATFDHPARGYYGGYVNPDEIFYLVDYLVMGAGAGVIELGYGTEHTFKLPVNITSQDIFAGSVYGRNSEGYVAKSSNWITQVAYFGPAMTLPYHESWIGQSARNGIWGGQSTDENAGLGESYWDIRDGSAGTVRPQDNDGGMMTLSTKVDNGGKRILSPRVTLEGTESPALVFYYQYSKKVLDFKLEIIVDDKPITVLKELDIKSANADKWIRMEVPLSDYKTSKYVQFGFSGHGLVGEDYACIDNVSISDLKTNDLSVTSFNAPVKVDVNTETKLTLGVRNNGSAKVAAGDYTVKFYKNGEELTELPGKDLNADEEVSIVASDYPTVADPSEIQYYAEVVYAADMKLADNTSSRSTVRVVIADYPTVSDLKAVSRNGVELSWSDPDMSEIPGVSVTETFENYESFIIDNIGSWTLHDGDKSTTVKMATSLGVLEYPHIGEAMAWQVFDPAEANVLNAAWYARSGSKMLVSFQAANSGTRDLKCDDWLISPELNATEQVISFYSRAGLSAYSPEVFDFMISDKTNAVADFKPLATDVTVPYTTDSWTEYTYRVPAGTRYFAIVHKSADKLAMLVDDITYIPAGSTPVQLDLEGFNVYRDGKRITAEPVGDNVYTDSDVEEGKEYTYRVSAVWDKGEARLSDPVTVTATSGLDNVTTYSLTISGHHGFIRISGGIGEQAMVYTASGVCVASVKAEGTVDVPVAAPGVYVVRAGSASAKVAVR
ncbi:MAG: choice-of-anchor J domain-containing protein [Muribaculaceae bacterium]|nr:choice-of-anchor J domain-containing protein [Muribaculaceae bacterium]